MNMFLTAYERLYERFGPQGWWPGDTVIEIMVGAVLTQNTSWGNVEKALTNLAVNGLLEFEALQACSIDEISCHIRPSGYYNVKAKRLKNLLTMIEREYGGSLESFIADEWRVARQKLLAVNGIGPETADSILLYCGGHPAFVVDMYTYRVFSRHNMIEEESDYGGIQAAFVMNLPEDVQLFNEYHALIVKVASTYCKKTKPLCGSCPLQGLNL